jgi:hypothetical protein
LLYWSTAYGEPSARRPVQGLARPGRGRAVHLLDDRRAQFLAGRVIERRQAELFARIVDRGVRPVEPEMAAANSSGGVMGKMIDAQSIVVASTATNWFYQSIVATLHANGIKVSTSCVAHRPQRFPARAQ